MDQTEGRSKVGNLEISVALRNAVHLFDTTPEVRIPFRNNYSMRILTIGIRENQLSPKMKKPNFHFLSTNILSFHVKYSSQ